MPNNLYRSVSSSSRAIIGPEGALKDVKPHTIPKNVVINVDLEDLSRKAAIYGPLRVFAETILNLCLLANDELRGQYNGSNMAGKIEDVRGGSDSKKSRPGRRR